jgi:hypothetical protein
MTSLFRCRLKSICLEIVYILTPTRVPLFIKSISLFWIIFSASAGILRSFFYFSSSTPFSYFNSSNDFLCSFLSSAAWRYYWRSISSWSFLLPSICEKDLWNLDSLVALNLGYAFPNFFWTYARVSITTFKCFWIQSKSWYCWVLCLVPFESLSSFSTLFFAKNNLI